MNDFFLYFITTEAAEQPSSMIIQQNNDDPINTGLLNLKKNLERRHSIPIDRMPSSKSVPFQLHTGILNYRQFYFQTFEYLIPFIK